MTVAIIDPTRNRAEQAAQAPSESRRAKSLAGLRIGLLENTKRNAGEMLDAVGSLLQGRADTGELVRRTKKQFAMPLTEELIADLRRECDVVVIGVGDCGSCSAAAVADGIALEQLGIPTAVICTDAFVSTSRAMAGLKGQPDYPFLVTEHPVANLDADGISARAQNLVDAVAARLVESDA